MVDQGNRNHFLLVTSAAQGHINPSLELAKRVIATTGAHVTFVTTVSAQRRMLNNSTTYPDGLTFAPFSDGYDDGVKPDGDRKHYMSELRRRGYAALSKLVENSASNGRRVTCLIYTILLPWASEVACKFQLSSALLWIQPAIVFDIYYYYFNGYRDQIIDSIDEPSYSVKLPGLPLLKGQDLPSFFLPSNPYPLVLELFREEFDKLSQKTKSFRVLVNTFDEIEPEAVHAIDSFNLTRIGPLIPSSLDDSLGVDLSEWLNMKDKSSVVYVSFGSMAVLTNKQMEELARGLVDSGRPFLWVIRSSSQQVEDEEEKYTEILRGEHRGMVVPWCSQMEVLNHFSLGCFVTHCGWNSTLETLGMGVPVVAFPQVSDQFTNAMVIEDVWKVGVRVRPSEEDHKIVKSEEILRCLEEVMDADRGAELRKNAEKLKNLIREAVSESGSSKRNLRAFVEELGFECL